MPTPFTKEEIISFLGLAGYLQTWIPNFSILVAPLYENSKGTLTEPLLNLVEAPFQTLRKALLQAPALHHPDVTRPYYLFVSEKMGSFWES